MLAPLAAYAGLELKGRVRRAATLALWLGLAAMLAAFGLGFALVALKDRLALALGATDAGLVVAGGLALVASAIAAFAWAMQARRRRDRAAAGAMAVAAAPVAAALVRRAAPSLVRAVPLILIAGFLVGRAIHRD